ncbi:MAG: PucR family transcriptional regulator [Lachnospiraceae bacterium]|nr:PucR family transcriptional regulator [Lachnospiraceae bacterium]
MKKLAITVKDVLEIAQSKGCILAAGEERLNRVVRYVDCMEIPNMEAWMRPNVLYITTGYAYSGTKEGILSLIRSLNDAKAAALAIKSRFIGQYLNDVLELAKNFQFPIIIMPEELAFVELNYAVMEALVKSQNNDVMKLQFEKYNRRELNRQFFVDLLAGNIVCEEECNHRIGELKWPKSPYRVMLVEIGGVGKYIKSLSEEKTEEVYEKIEKIIKEILQKEKYSAVVLSNNSIFPCIIKCDVSELQKEQFEQIQEQISKKMDCDVIIGISSEGNSYQKFQEIYQSAMDALEIAKSFEGNKKVVCIDTAGYWKLLKEISSQPICKEYVSKELDALIQYDKENDSNLLETLETLVNYLGARNLTATKLYLHRNTLMYRIKKIEHLTGYNLSDPDSVLELSLALRLKRFM